jgi:Ca-activated chloride channel family protein
VRYLYPLSTEKFSTEPLEDVSITVRLSGNQPIRAVYSPDHPISINRENNYQVIVGYEDQDVLPDKDFSLYYSIGESQAFHLLTFRDPSDIDDPDGFFFLLLAPGIRESVRPVPKDILLVLDHSGSMDGEKFRQSQDAIRFILKNLNPDDRFNLITFSTGIEVFSHDLLPASAAEEAIQWVGRLRAEGSTDINRALLEAVSMVDKERPTYLIFLTDGLPTVGVVDSEQIIDNIAEAAPKNLSLFAFGVGYDVDTYLLDTLVRNHHGSTTYVVPGEQLDEILSGFYNKIRAPVLTDLKLDFGEAVTYDIFPDPFPDLFVGSQIAIVGRYREGVTTDIELSGMVDGQIQIFEYRDQVFNDKSPIFSGTITSLPRLWATRKIGYLLNQVRLIGPDQETIDQLVRLSIRYGIVTPYTSFLVTESLPLGPAEQERIVAEEFNDLKAQAGLPSFGRQAVEKAEGQSSLESADSVASIPEAAVGKVRVVGSHTFVNHDGVWIDTLFEPGEMKTEKVEFLSDGYFKLTRSVPDLVGALALGEKVIVVSGGVNYEVTVDNQVDLGSVTPTPTDDEYEGTIPIGSDLEPEKPLPDAPEFFTDKPLACLSGLLIAFLPLAYLGIRIQKDKE